MNKEKILQEELKLIDLEFEYESNREKLKSKKSKVFWAIPLLFICIMIPIYFKLSEQHTVLNLLLGLAFLVLTLDAAFQRELKTKLSSQRAKMKEIKMRLARLKWGIPSEIEKSDN